MNQSHLSWAMSGSIIDFGSQNSKWKDSRLSDTLNNLRVLARVVAASKIGLALKLLILVVNLPFHQSFVFTNDSHDHLLLISGLILETFVAAIPARSSFRRCRKGVYAPDKGVERWGTKFRRQTLLCQICFTSHVYSVVSTSTLLTDPWACPKEAPIFWLESGDNCLIH